MTKLSRYIRKHEKPASISVANGKGTIELQFTDGYVTIHSVQPRSAHLMTDIHIERSAWHALFMSSPKMRSLSVLMEGPDFDRYKAERIYQKQEQQHLQELRDQKAVRRGKRRRRR